MVVEVKGELMNGTKRKMTGVKGSGSEGEIPRGD